MNSAGPTRIPARTPSPKPMTRSSANNKKTYQARFWQAKLQRPFMPCSTLLASLWMRIHAHLWNHDSNTILDGCGFILTTRQRRSANALAANAYAVGNRIIFSSGQYAPNSQQGRTLIAHELAHVVQQSRGGTAGKLQEISHVNQRLIA